MVCPHFECLAKAKHLLHIAEEGSSAPAPSRAAAPEFDYTGSVTIAPNPEFLRRAIQLATENAASGLGGPFGAVVARDGVLVGEGVNTVTRELDPTAHAEVNAIRAAARKLGAFSLAGCQLYSSCQPCPMCLAACYWARLDCVFFGASAEDAAHAGFDDFFLYEELRKPAYERTLVARQLLADEARHSFAAWKASAVKVLY